MNVKFVHKAVLLLFSFFSFFISKCFTNMFILSSRWYTQVHKGVCFGCWRGRIFIFLPSGTPQSWNSQNFSFCTNMFFIRTYELKFKEGFVLLKYVLIKNVLMKKRFGSRILCSESSVFELLLDQLSRWRHCIQNGGYPNN